MTPGALGMSPSPRGTGEVSGTVEDSVPRSKRLGEVVVDWTLVAAYFSEVELATRGNRLMVEVYPTLRIFHHQTKQVFCFKFRVLDDFAWFLICSGLR